MVPFEETIKTKKELVEACTQGYQDWVAHKITKNDFCMFFGFTHGEAITKFYTSNYCQLLVDGGFAPGSDAYFSAGINAYLNLKKGCYSFPPIMQPKQLTNSSHIIPLQQIYFGAPGSGKSWTLNNETKGCDVIRTTFHPDSDYSTFVGVYKPVEEKKKKTQVVWDFSSRSAIELPVKKADGSDADEESIITYKFIRQAFLQAYIKAWLKNNSYIKAVDALITFDAKSSDEDGESGVSEENNIQDEEHNWNPNITNKNGDLLPNENEEISAERQTILQECNGNIVYLIIEEINRGNCAQIFGDLFQSLDREEYGFSKYPITPDTDIQKELQSALAGKIDPSINTIFTEKVKWLDENNIEHEETASEAIGNGHIIVLPNNLFLRATMNTSDQSLFPMDSAFKRRWDWRYFAIKDGQKGYKVDVDGATYDWWETIQRLNEKILAVTNSADKQMGYFFVKPKEDGIISAETFVSKVIFYLWNDVFKDYNLDDENNPFTENTRFEKFWDENGKVKVEVLKEFLDALKEEIAPADDPDPAPDLITPSGE